MDLLGVDRAGLYVAYPEPVTDEIAVRFNHALRRRLAGEPVAYITGHREFMGLDFIVDPRVLVPRPETEGLVEWALEHVRRRGGCDHAIVDVGTGSGAIAVSIAYSLPPDPPRLIVGSDRSLAALAVARVNAERLTPGRVQLVCGNLLDWCRGRVDLILANLPYLRPDEAHPGIAHEPARALYADGAGFALYHELLRQAALLLAPGGAIGCEIGMEQGERAAQEAHALFPNAVIRVEQDLAGRDRYLLIENVYSA